MDFQVNYGALDGAAADIKTGASNLQGCLDDLENTLNQLRSSWEGQAQEAYNAAQVKWNQGLEGLKDVLPAPPRPWTPLVPTTSRRTRLPPPASDSTAHTR